MTTAESAWPCLTESSIFGNIFPNYDHVKIVGNGLHTRRVRGKESKPPTAAADSRLAGQRVEAEPQRAGPDLDAGNPVELGAEYRELKSVLPKLSVVGGCCGTDHRHVAEICRAMNA